MSEDEAYLVKTYFAQWEIRDAKAILAKSGRSEAMKYLVDEIASFQRGYSGPDIPYVNTTHGRIFIANRPGSATRFSCTYEYLVNLVIRSWETGICIQGKLFEMA
jgi:hypothetical protein